jgi:hypothetical protein
MSCEFSYEALLHAAWVAQVSLKGRHAGASLGHTTAEAQPLASDRSQGLPCESQDGRLHLENRLKVQSTRKRARGGENGRSLKAGAKAQVV